jgi:hypothetical protein
MSQLYGYATAFPVRKGEEMLAFAHIPTGATANEEFEFDEVKATLAASASTMTAIAADIETSKATP